jgi:hypothetical protein
MITPVLDGPRDRPDEALSRHGCAPRNVATAVLVLACALGSGHEAHALPVFARETGSSCANCHTVVPALNAVGMRVLQSGDGARTMALLSRHRPPRGALVLDAGATTQREQASPPGSSASRRRETQVARGYEFDVHVVGGLLRRLSFEAEAGMDSATSPVGLQVAALRVHDVVGAGALSLRAGRFDAGLPMLSAERRTTRAPYLAPVEVDAHGLELSATHAAWSGALGMSASHRSNTAGRTVRPLEDTYGRLTGERDGQVFGARLLFDRQDSNISFHAWLQRLQLQVGALLGGGRFWIVPAYTLDRFDDRPAPGIHQRHQYGMLEALGVLGADRRWTLAARFELEHTTPTKLTPGEDGDLAAVRLGRVLAPNATLSLEASRVALPGTDRRPTRLDAALRLAL